MIGHSQSFGDTTPFDGSRSLSAIVALIIIAAGIWVGIRAREATVEIGSRQIAWEQTANQLSKVKRQFQAPTPRESAALAAESGRLNALVVADGEQLNVMATVTRLAESASLANVRVSSVPAADSGRRPSRRVGAAAIGPASYEIAVEFDGSFARAVQWMSSLPPSVALARMTAGRRAGTPAYQVFLSVYQVDAKSGN